MGVAEHGLCVMLTSCAQSHMCMPSTACTCNAFVLMPIMNMLVSVLGHGCFSHQLHFSVLGFKASFLPKVLSQR